MVYHFSLLVEPPVLIVSPSSQSVNLTQTATFICNVTGYNISYQWTGSLPSKAYNTNTSTLVIPDVRSSDDSNTYICKASNEGGNVTSDGAILTVTGKMYVHTYVHI